MKYHPKQEELDRVARNFTYHPPKEDQPERYNRLRAMAGDLAQLYMLNAPLSRELSLALTHLEESVMWVNAAIARNE